MALRSPELQASDLLNAAGVTAIPVPLTAIAKHLDVQVIHQRMETHVSGITYRNGGTIVIGINSTHHARRQRFTLAHELGHVCMHPGKPLLVDSNIRVNFRDPSSSLATDQQEIDANQFAAALLMPNDILRRQMSRLIDDGIRGRDRLTAALATNFDVSTEAMGYRLINLGLTTA